MKKIIIFTVLLLIAFSAFIQAEPQSSIDADYYYGIEYQFLEGLSPFTVLAQREFKKNTSIRSIYALTAVQSFAFNHLPSYLSLDAWFIDNQDFSIIGKGAMIIDTDMESFTFTYGGKIELSRYGCFSLDVVKTGSYETIDIGEYGNSSFVNWGFDIYTGKIINIPGVPSIFSFNAIQKDSEVDGYVTAVALDIPVLKFLSFGHTDRLDRFFGELYLVDPFIEILSANIGCISEEPYLRSLQLNVDIMPLIVPEFRKKDLIARIDIGVEHTLYTQWETDLYGAPEDGEWKFSVSARFYGSANGGTFGAELNPFAAVRSIDSPDNIIRRIMSVFLGVDSAIF